MEFITNYSHTHSSQRTVQLELYSKLWDKCQNNPISDISFEYYMDGGIKWKKVSFVFCNEPSVTYFIKDLPNSDDEWEINPVKYIKKVLPENLYEKVFYFYDALGTLIILKGSFHEFPMTEILGYFYVEVLSYNKFALCMKSQKAYRQEIYNKLSRAAYSI